MTIKSIGHIKEASKYKNLRLNGLYDGTFTTKKNLITSTQNP